MVGSSRSLPTAGKAPPLRGRLEAVDVRHGPDLYKASWSHGCRLQAWRCSGDLSLDKMLNHPLHRFGLAEDGPAPIYTSETKFILNQGNVVRGRKRSAPSAHADLLDYDDSGESSGALIKSIAQAKAHLFILCEAGAISDSELQFLYGRGWESFRNPARDLLVEHLVGSKMRQLTGSTLVGVAHHHLHLMIVEITFGKLFPSVDKATEEAFLIRP